MKKVQVFTAALALLASTIAVAEPTGGPFSVVNVRPYSNGPWIYLHVDSASLCGTQVFAIDTTLPNGKEMYAAVLTSMVTGEKD